MSGFNSQMAEVRLDNYDPRTPNVFALGKLLLSGRPSHGRLSFQGQISLAHNRWTEDAQIEKYHELPSLFVVEPCRFEVLLKHASTYFSLEHLAPTPSQHPSHIHRYIHYITLHYITLHYITLHYITLHYITLHYITLHYITLHYITLHYITYIHTYTYSVCMHVCMYIYIYVHIYIYIYGFPTSEGPRRPTITDPGTDADPPGQCF